MYTSSFRLMSAVAAEILAIVLYTQATFWGSEVSSDKGISGAFGRPRRRSLCIAGQERKVERQWPTLPDGC